MKSLLVAMGAIMVFAPGASAANLVYNEAVNGDLSGDSLNPTTVNLSVGSNQIIGSTTGNPNLDRDFFTFTILPDFQLSQVILADYFGQDNVGANQSFLAVQTGSSIATEIVLNTTPQPLPLLGAALIGAAPGTQEGDNVLDDLGVAAPIQGRSFIGFDPGVLGAGTYTFWLQETVGGDNYALNFVVTPVPEPSTIIGMGAIAGLATLLKRKKR